MLKPYLQANRIEAGCDEAGRGCLAGPVCAAAVILPTDFENELLNDSKKLTAKQRNQLRIVIEKEALAYAVAFGNIELIDDINILQASFWSMHEAIKQLSIRPEALLIDGNRFKPFEDIPHDCIIKGDGKYLSIAAASILAKTYRDEYMMDLHQGFPVYAWKQNKGYPTKAHREAIQMHGISPHHRRSFKLLPDPQLFK